MTRPEPDWEMACGEPEDGPKPRSHEDIGGIVGLVYAVPAGLLLWLVIALGPAAVWALLWAWERIL